MFVGSSLPSYHFNDYWELGLPMILWFFILAFALIPAI